MRIGIFTDTYKPDVNGVVTSVLALEKQLRKMGHEVYIVCPHKGKNSKREGNIFYVPGVELKNLYGYVLSVPYDKKIKQAIMELNLDIIHVQQEFSVGIFGRILANQLEIPLVYTYHTMYEDYTNYVNLLHLKVIDEVAKKIVERGTRLMCSSAQYILAPSVKTKNKLQDYRVKRPIEVVPTGVEVERFDRKNLDDERLASLREDLGFSKDDNILVYVGRIAPEKSLDMLLAGFEKLNNQKAKLLIVGGGPSLEGFEKQYANDKRIVFTDKVDPQVIPYYYGIADAFISASTSETQGLTFIESMASGLPIFARKEETALEGIVKDGYNGYLFSNAEELAQKLGAFLTADDNKRLELANNAITTAQHFDTNHFGEKIIEVYKKAINEYRSCFFIEQVKMNNDCVKLKLSNKAEDLNTTLLISLDDYVFYDLKVDSYLDFALYEVLKEKEQIIKAYNGCIKKLKNRDRTRKEIYDYLINLEPSIDIKYINGIIERLENKGYIDDYAYTLDAIKRYDNALVSKRKMVTKLQEKGIPRELSTSLLNVDEDDDNEYEKAYAKAIKIKKGMRGKAVQKMKLDLKNKLYREGFSHNVINATIDKLNFEDEKLQEVVILDKVIDKAKKHYGSKYSGYKLKQKIIQYAMNKGFLYEDIKQALEMRDE